MSCGSAATPGRPPAAWPSARGAGGTAEVRFADGRFFYLLDLRPGRWEAEHGCGEDRYLLAHRVLSDDLLEERWRVRGPAKDYLAITRLQRRPLSG